MDFSTNTNLGCLWHTCFLGRVTTFVTWRPFRLRRFIKKALYINARLASFSLGAVHQTWLIDKSRSHRKNNLSIVID